MKHLLFLLLACCTAAAALAQSPVNIGVIPTPRSVTLHNGTCPLNPLSDAVDYRFVDSLPGTLNQGQSYRLDIRPNSIRVTYTGDEARQYALQTLRQLHLRYPDGLPCMTILDWPAYTYRGWLDDISRGPFPNAAFRQQQAQFQQTYKMNFGSYYTEHSLYNPEYPDLAPVASLDTLPADLHAMANLQCFAHFEKTLRIPYYEHLKDSPTNLNPAHPGSYALLRSQIANTLRFYCDAKLLNINCDETEGLGSGRAHRYVDSLGATEAYVRHIDNVYSMVQDIYRSIHPDSHDTLRVLMWGDIVAKSPEMLQRLPRGMEYVVWSYGAQPDYNAQIQPFLDAHVPFWVAPGVSHWSSIPNVPNYIPNIAFLARDGHRAGALGLINTAWDDSGESLFGNCWHAMAWAAEMAWNPLTETDPQRAEAELQERQRRFNENYDRLCGYPASRMIYAVGDLNKSPWVDDWYNTFALLQPLMNFYPDNTGDRMLERCDSVEALLARTLALVDSAAEPHFAFACHRMQCVAMKSRLRVLLFRHDSVVPSLLPRYFAALHRLKLEYLRLWDQECTDYSRNIICDRYDALGREALDALFFVNASCTPVAGGRQQVTLATLLGDGTIYYTLDGRTPSRGATRYSAPFTIDRSCLLRTVCYNEYDEPVFSEHYLLCHPGMGHLRTLGTPYSNYRPAYSGGGDNALADGLLGSDDNYADGHWQGYWGEDIVADYDFDSVVPVGEVSMRFLQNSTDWILSPRKITLYTSVDGSRWTQVSSKEFYPDFRQLGTHVVTLTLDSLNLRSRHLRVKIHNPGPLPAWHMSHGQPSYLFCDEIVVSY